MILYLSKAIEHHSTEVNQCMHIKKKLVDIKNRMQNFTKPSNYITKV